MNFTSKIIYLKFACSKKFRFDFSINLSFACTLVTFHYL